MDRDSRLSDPDESSLSNPPPSDSDDSSDSSDSDVEAVEAQDRTSEEQQTQQQTQWLATTRARRSTAGNRMKSMLANEEPDSDLELLFAEDENDEGFSDAQEDASDMQMDSSADEGDDAEGNNAGDELEGEKELERQAREKRAAQRKRKARAAIPAKFRKRVRIETAAAAAAASDVSTPMTMTGPMTGPKKRGGLPPAPAPRPRKKSERLSWLPSPADLPTRASSRETTRLSKEQLHQQMVEREERRLRQVALMEKKAARMEALKKPPLTQEDRLREAAVVEKRNSKSLNRWEVAEKQREEERRAKLAALHQRTLQGPVITFWSGIGEARRAVVEEQEKPKKRRERTDKGDKGRNKADKADGRGGGGGGGGAAGQDSKDAGQSASQVGLGVPPAPPPGSGAPSAPAATATSQEPLARDDSVEQQRTVEPVQGPLAMPSSSVPTPPGIYPDKSSTGKPAGVLAAPILAPPPTMAVDLPPPRNPKSNVLAPPNTSQLASGPAPPLHRAQPSTTTTARFLPPEDAIDKSVAHDASSGKKAAAVPPSAAEASEASAASAALSTTTRNAIILRNFDDNAIRDKAIQTQILFGRKMSKLTKPPPGPICAITNLPARYRDPESDLPYHNAYAYREIQRLRRGEHHFSKILNAWVGSNTAAARGVPERFLNPGAPGNGKKAKADTDTVDEAEVSGKQKDDDTGAVGKASPSSEVIPAEGQESAKKGKQVA